MKSMSILFLAAAVLAYCLGGAGLRANGANVLISSMVSQETWMRSCSYAGPDGLRTIEVDAAWACPVPSSLARAPVRQAQLSP